jgi:hypothetical protein
MRFADNHLKGETMPKMYICAMLAHAEFVLQETRKQVRQGLACNSHEAEERRDYWWAAYRASKA